MAQLTPAEILAISEPIEAIYQRTVDELLINIAHHFNISGWERTRYWEIKKLSEMGALTKESARIIAQNTKMLPGEIEKAFLQVAEKACLDIDPQLRKAAEKGILQDPGTSPSTSVLMRDSIRSYVEQAQDTLNMVNTTMLQSTREAYLRGIATAVSEAQLQEAKEILETQALEVVTGQETRVRAIRKAMNQLSATGITGFYDRSGRKWHAESYAAMVVRSTSHNAAIQAIKTRQQEFGGGDIFQVSSHNGARPLCFPYQGKFYSWSAGPGEFEDGSGQTRRYENIDQTSYGEPAGLFGINCGHHPIPMIPGFSYPQEGPTQTKAENDKEYRESQTQRAYERQVREAKRDLEIAKATGDEEAIKDARQKVAQEQAKIRAYVAETGRARRYDREQIAGGKEYEGYKGYRQMRNSDIPLDNRNSKVSPNEPDKPIYTQSELSKYGFSDGNGGEIKRKRNAVVYETNGIKIIFPKDLDKSKQTMTPELLIEQYRLLPDELKQRGQKTIEVVDYHNPQDSYWKKRYKNFHHSYATGGEKIVFYQYERKHDEKYVSGTLRHEIGHYIDKHIMQGTAKYSETKGWREAVESDTINTGAGYQGQLRNIKKFRMVSEYSSKSSLGEDFADSIKLYTLNKTEFKANYPARARILEIILTRSDIKRF